MDDTLIKTLSLALGIGLLIGFQRQRTGSGLGGIRTYSLIALLGAVCGVLAREWDLLIASAGLLGVIALVVMANVSKAQNGASTSGQTSEAAALLTYALGVFIAMEHYAAALVVGGITAVLLHLKEPLHEAAQWLSEADVRAIMRLVIISLVILPLLPDETFGPYDVLNPREIWFMVVLIVAIGLTGYLSYKLFSGKAGTIIGGMLGGLISSTATTVAYARRARGTRGTLAVAGVIIGIAWAVSLARVIVEVMVVAPMLMLSVVPPLAVLLAVMIAACAGMWLTARGKQAEMPAQRNPAELTSALIFGAIYAAVLFITAAAKDYFGDNAIYAVAVISGVVDVDAITLSTARLGAANRLEPESVWRVIMLASLSNVVFKSAAVLALGSPALFARMLPIFSRDVEGQSTQCAKSRECAAPALLHVAGLVLLIHAQIPLVFG